METKKALASLSALAQASRLAVFRHLVEAGPEGETVGRIGEALGIAPATLSFHLKELSHAGLVSSRQESRFFWYSADYTSMKDLIAYLTDKCCGGQPCEVSSCAPAKPKRKKKTAVAA